MACLSCFGRSKRLLKWLGFTDAIHGGMERVTERGRVLVDMKRYYPMRAALLGCCVRLLQGKD